MYDIPSGESLRQGDILNADLMRKELRGHLDYFAEQPYFVAFCVLTQSCDLVANRCVDFATLAVVRELTHAFSWHLPDDSKSTQGLLTKIISHNLNKRAYFYLHPNHDAGLTKASVVDLRVCFSVSLHKTEGHYPALLNARRASLTEGFGAALGWMTSQVYGRVATKDWDELQLNLGSSDEYVKALWTQILEEKRTIEKTRATMD